MSVRLAVFDCDGTLVDSQANIVRAMDLCFAQRGLAPPGPPATRRIVGLSLLEAMRALVPDLDPAEHASLADDYRRVFQGLRADNALDPEPLYDGIAEALAALAADGWALGVATGKSDRGLGHILDHHGLRHCFVTLQTADRHPSKPHPAMLRAAMADAGVAPAATVIIGDTVFDMAMGVAAGVRAIGVDWGYHDAHELHDAGASAVVATTAELLACLAPERTIR